MDISFSEFRYGLNLAAEIISYFKYRSIKINKTKALRQKNKNDVWVLWENIKVKNIILIFQKEQR